MWTPSLMQPIAPCWAVAVRWRDSPGGWSRSSGGVPFARRVQDRRCEGNQGIQATRKTRYSHRRPGVERRNAGEDELLASCYRRSLEVADQLDIKSIAFPAISTGIYRFPPQRAAEIAVSEIRCYTGGIERLVFACFDGQTADIYRGLLMI